MYVAGGTVALDNVTLSGNSAESNFSICYGGGLYVAGGNVTLTNDIITQNAAGSPGNYRYGGGVFIAPGPTVIVSAIGQRIPRQESERDC